MARPGKVKERLVPFIPTAGVPLDIVEKVKSARSNQIISDTYPYSTRLSRRKYERDRAKLQIELLKMQRWAIESGERIVLLFEGRDAAGKGGAIKRFMEHLNPRGATLVALSGAVRQGAWAMVLSALRSAPADERGDRILRPVLVQPGGGGAGDGILHDGRYVAVSSRHGVVRGDANKRRHSLV